MSETFRRQPGGESPKGPASTRLIVTADDFGRSPEINRSVMRAHQEGVLTSASLMVTADAAEEAVAFARRTPTLAVGLHLVLVAGRSALPQSAIPQLVDGNGRFPQSPAKLGIGYLFSRAVRRAVRQELRAQFDRFAATGLPLTHVDGHMHIHLHPAVFPTVVRLAREYGAYGVRIPRDRLLYSLRWSRRRAPAKCACAVTFGPLSRWSAHRMRGCGLVSPERCYGLLQSGHMQEGYVIDVLRRIREPSAEIYFHPTLGDRLDPLGPNRDDLAALLSLGVRRVVEERRIELATYSTLIDP